jgi:hypothetical protein
MQFWELARSFEEVYIIIDGLDECQEDSRRQILQFILDPTQGTSAAVGKDSCGSNNENTERGSKSKSENENRIIVIKAIVISRHETDIAEVFRRHANPTLRIENENVAPDIARFVHGETESLIQEERLRIYNHELKNKIINRLISEANGM